MSKIVGRGHRVKVKVVGAVVGGLAGGAKRGRFHALILSKIGNWNFILEIKLMTSKMKKV